MIGSLFEGFIEHNSESNKLSEFDRSFVSNFKTIFFTCKFYEMVEIGNISKVHIGDTTVFFWTC